MAQELHELRETYRGFTDQELLRLAAVPEDLSEDANSALQQEMARRSLKAADVISYREEKERITAAREAPPSPAESRVIQGLFGWIGYKIFETFRDIARGKR